MCTMGLVWIMEFPTIVDTNISLLGNISFWFNIADFNDDKPPKAE